MTISLGRKQFKSLKLGGDTITTIHKGDELIYRDLEALYAYKFTIDTTLKNDGTKDTSDATMNLYLYGWKCYRGGMKIYWGDGKETTATITDSNYRININHTYPEPGTYQISIVPTNWNSDGTPIKGWLSPMKWSGGDYGAAHKIVSIDKKLPDESIIVCPGTSPTDYFFTDTFGTQFSWMCNVESIPDGWLDGVVFEKNGATSYNSLFSETFSRFNQFSQNYIPVFPLLQQLIDLVDFSGVTGTYNMFSSVISRSCGRCTEIPDNAITIDFKDCPVYPITFAYIGSLNTGHAKIGSNVMNITSSGTNVSGAFSSFFNYTFENCTSVEFSDGPIVSIDAPNATNCTSLFSYFFDHSFANCAGGELTFGPEKLSYNLPSIKNATKMFYYFFYSSFTKLDKLEIKSGTFFVSGEIENATRMFSEVFFWVMASGYTGQQSLTFIVEQGAIGTDSQSLTNTSYMFSNTYDYIGGNSSAPTKNAVIHTDAISPINTDNVTDFSYMFQTPVGQGVEKSAKDQDGNSYKLKTGQLLSSTANGIDFTGMFENTHQWVRPYGGPGGAISNITTPNGVKFSYMFSSAFTKKDLDQTYEGLFENIDTTNWNGVLNDIRYLFYQTFDSGGTSSVFTLPDLFANMPSYNWISQDTVDNGYIVDGMFSGGHTSDSKLKGQAATILQHFNLTPTRRTKMFYYCTGLDDYETINDNWK